MAKEGAKNATTKGKQGKAVNVNAARNAKKRKLSFSKPENPLDLDGDNADDDDYVENKGMGAR